MSTAWSKALYKIVTYVPRPNADAVKQAMFQAGAGTLPGSHYDQCCFETLGTGQFRPIQGADPAIGKIGIVEHVDEVRIETTVHDKDTLIKTREAIIKAHPYEEVVIDIFAMLDVDQL